MGVTEEDELLQRLFSEVSRHYCTHRSAEVSGRTSTAGHNPIRTLSNPNPAKLCTNILFTHSYLDF